jgi:hypothetical protein
MSRLNIVPDMTHDFLLALSRGEGLSQVRYFSGDFFFVSFIIFLGFLHCFSCWCCFSSGFSRSYQLRLCSVQTAPLDILENCFEKKIIFGWFSKPVSTQYEIRQFFIYLLINYLQKFVTVNLFTSNKLT